MQALTFSGKNLQNNIVESMNLLTYFLIQTIIVNERNTFSKHRRKA